MKQVLLGRLKPIPRIVVSRQVVVVSVALLLAVCGAAFAAGPRHEPAGANGRALASGPARGTATGRLVLRVAHGPVTAANSQYIDAAPTGPSVGDLRTYYLPLTRRGSHRPIGYLTGTLTTVAMEKPTAGMELRTANLVFVVGHPADQLVVGGVSAYAQTIHTISRRSVVKRPVLGGSGRYAGARGWCVSTHRANGTWTHVFHVDLA